MHKEAINNAVKFFSEYILTSDIKILDVGSYNVNGTLKDICPKGSLYIGIDIEKGNNVDYIIENYKFPFKDNEFDVIISSSCFEHCDFFWIVFLEMVRCLKSGGYIYIDVPSTGHYHPYPEDSWRFYPDSGKVLTRWGNYNNYSLSLERTYIDKSSNLWNDNIIIIKKH